ncbi:hypothetical protein CYMTET_6683 [Cymbomonas tetramitiformis]|uniref:Uncharacterized protein n=1 Tax=Cymbomonas tetramitiformis TaxID=36881 RepID=A0AAE0LHU1_9CHLO|nr:hypothetical protein CYMTET_6683 [Cymbomonas tetramitiformis]
MCARPNDNLFAAEIARTLSFVRDSRVRDALLDEERVQRTFRRCLYESDGLLGDSGRWWRKNGPRAAAVAYLESVHSEQLCSRLDDASEFYALFPVLVGHDLIGIDAGQAKMYSVMPWTRMLCYALTPFSTRQASAAYTKRQDCSHVPSPCANHVLPAGSTPTRFYHCARFERCPIHCLVLDFDFPDPMESGYHVEHITEEERRTLEALALNMQDPGETARRIHFGAAWRAARSSNGPVARATRLIESRWSRWFPGCTAHVLLLETRRRTDSLTEPVDSPLARAEILSKPSVHGYLFQRFTDLSTEGTDDGCWPFQGPVFEDKSAYATFFRDFVHPALREDAWFLQRGIRAECFLDAVCGPTVRAVGMAKWESNAASFENPRYSHADVAMPLSDPLALRSYTTHRAFATGRMLGLFTDVTVPTVRRAPNDELLFVENLSQLLRDTLIDAKRRKVANTATLGAMTRPTRLSTRLARPTFASATILTPLLRTVIVAALQSVGASCDDADRVELDATRVSVTLGRRIVGEDCKATVMVVQSPDCAFCPIRDLSANLSSFITLTRRGDNLCMPRLLPLDRTAARAHTSGGKMWFLFRIDTRAGSDANNTLSHSCWKCFGRGMCEKRGMSIGVIPRRAVIEIAQLVKEFGDTQR